ncbi:MAG: hypothetical protein ACTFAL_14275 [Candidatus Electronema sp. V4]|uniref:hypothetical protein n=1 Tax=Candidatus Electronema sp. V4 TaxID=3454756 RepID=UPI004055946D
MAFSAESDSPLITYSLVPHMLAEQDATPLLRIYESGRVLVHQPKHSPKAGDYETELSNGELQKLLNMVTEKGLDQFDAKDVASKRNSVKKAKEKDTGITRAVSEVDETRIEVNASGNGRKNISWNNLSHDVEQYPEVSELRKLAEAEKVLKDILQRDDLRRLDAE